MKRRVPNDGDPRGAKLALVRAEANLVIAQTRAGTVQELTSKLKIEGSDNHFIQRLNLHKQKDEYQI